MGSDKPSDSEVTEPDVLLEEFQQTLIQFVSGEGGGWPEHIANKSIIPPVFPRTSHASPPRPGGSAPTIGCML